jgi:biotin transport system substrate-specific component
LSESIAAVTGYILLGAFGFPVFAGSIAGAAVLLGTTGGYIFGFLLATIVCGALYTQWGVKNFSTYLMLSLLGVVLIFICGVAVLANFMGVKMAYALGVQPFLFTESMKIVLLASVLSLKNAF